LVVETLKQNGHKLVPWDPYKHDFAVDLANKIYASDGCTVTHPTVVIMGRLDKG